MVLTSFVSFSLCDSRPPSLFLRHDFHRQCELASSILVYHHSRWIRNSKMYVELQSRAYEIFVKSKRICLPAGSHSVCFSACKSSKSSTFKQFLSINELNIKSCKNEMFLVCTRDEIRKRARKNHMTSTCPYSFEDSI